MEIFGSKKSPEEQLKNLQAEPSGRCTHWRGCKGHCLNVEEVVNQALAGSYADRNKKNTGGPFWTQEEWTNTSNRYADAGQKLYNCGEFSRLQNIIERLKNIAGHFID